ncbi:TGF-beta-activated kinase 1 and MAP3K7-binding protein 2-like [Liolophura sinensis]|uniref:TGF-beta-activated kinase 1 and MAP3K7-binding protein 2-like n=1 Tax=Liolophura sinensis TaxID=3198878 RepID=UPI003158BE9D
MAAPDSAINLQLFHELKTYYPEIPDYIVADLIQQHSNNKNKCLEVLAGKSPKHMFGDYTSETSGFPVVQQLGDLRLMDPQSVRQRSDSGSSLKSNASTGSLPCIGSGLVASLANAWPPVTVNSQAPAASPNTDSSASGRSPDFGPFLQHSRSTGQIPNIECNTNVASPNRHSGSEIPSGSPEFCSPHKSSYIVKPAPSHASGDTPPQTAPKRTVFSQMNSNMYPVGQFSPETHVQNSGAGHHERVPTPQHLSQATIYIKNRKPEDRNANMTTMPQVAIQPQLQIQQPPASHVGSRIPVHHFISKQDQQSSQIDVSSSQFNNVLGRYQLGQASSPVNSTGVTGPFLVECNYDARPQIQVSVSSVTPPISGVFSTPTNPPSSVYQPTFNPPDIPGRRDVMPSTNVSTISYPAHTFLPNYQTMITTLPKASKAGSPTREDYTSSRYNNMVPFYPAGLQRQASPTPSQSSASSEASQREGSTQLAASQQDERDYIKALLSHQHVRKETLESDLDRETKKLEQLRGQVTQMEENMAESSQAFPTVEDLTKLRDSNRKLLTEIQCMTREIDMYNQGRTPLGIWNAQDEQFFQHLDQGRPSALPNVGVPLPHRVPLHTHAQSHTPQRPTQTLTPPRTSRPLPSVPAPVPNITSQVPPAPGPQANSSSGDSEEGEQWSCTACTFLNHPALNKCECCEIPRVHLGSQ